MSNLFDIDTSPETPELLQIAEKELRETPEIRKQGIAELRDLLKKNSDLYFSDDEEFLIIILRVCHWYPESAIKLLRQIAEFRRDNEKLIKDLMPEHVKIPFLEGGVVNVLTNKDHKNRRVLIVNSGKLWEPSVVSADSMFKIFYLIHIMAQLEKSTQICGCVVIYDFDDLGMKQIAAMTPTSVQRLLTFIQFAMPLRLKEVHFVKQPFIFNLVWKLMKPFVKEKLKNRMYFHGSDMKKLHAFIPPEYLPKNYGGTMPEINYSGRDWYPCVEKHIDFFTLYNTFGFKK